MSILITGSSGLVGSAVSPLFPNSLTPKSSQLNINNSQETKNFLSNNNIDIIIHLAANVGGLFKNMNQKVKMLEDNLIMNYNIIKEAHNHNIQKIIICLSTCIFPDNIKYPINENALLLGPPHFSNDAYAYAKRMAFIQANAYNLQYNRQYISIIPTNIYGEFDNFNLEDSHVIPALIHKAFLAKKYNNKFIVKGTGNPLRQFIYSKDLAILIKYIVLLYDSIEPIILAPSEEYSIGHIAKIIADKFQIELEFDNISADGQYKKTADNSKLMKFLKKNNIDFQFTPIEKGLNDTIDWFISNYDIVRK